jgi:hypothetical protein
MRRVKIEQWCDFCWQDDEQETTAVHTFVVGIVEDETTRPALKIVETCDVHSTTITDLLRLLEQCAPYQSDHIVPGKAAPKRDPQIAALFASPTRALPPSQQPHDCPLCPRSMSKGALVDHIWKIHRPDDRPEPSNQCPDCGVRMSSAQAIGQHRRHSHDYDALQHALAGVPGHRRAITA